MNRHRGFTLLELLMALALLTLTIGLLLASANRSARQVRAAEAQNHAVLYAENLLDDLGYGQALAPGRYAGTFANPRYRWTLHIDPVDAASVPGLPIGSADAPMAVYRIALDVHWDSQHLRWVSLRAVKRAHRVDSP